MAYGYRAGEVQLPKLPDMDHASIKVLRKSDQARRPPMMVSMGPIILGAAPPHPDNSDSNTLLAGVLKRMAGKMPDANPVMLEKLAKFAENWLEQHCTSLAPDEDLSFESWIETRPYPAWRKQELREVHEKMIMGKLLDEYRDVKLFMKDETYPEFKHGRGIYARCDEFKVLFGPLCSRIEEDMYSNPQFIKHVPVAERPQYIEEMLVTETEPDATTDFSSFEMSFVKRVMKVLDFVMFRFYLRHMNSKFYSSLYKSLAGNNFIKNRYFVAKIEARRMSGEMNTSLSNGFANLMVNMFLCQYHGCGIPRMVVEGDDGRMKTPTGKYPTPAQYAELGFNIKIQLHKDGNTASFCGIIYDRDERLNVTDPKEVLLNFGWATQRYARCKSSKLKALLRSKCLCYLHQYPGCPIIQDLALYGLRMTRGISMDWILTKDKGISMWERQQLLDALETKQIWTHTKEVGIKTRILVEDLFGISIEKQLEIETYLNSKTDLSALEIDLDFNKDSVLYFTAYCREILGDPAFGFDCYVRPDVRDIERLLNAPQT